jgi:hypothetical protein
MEMVSFQFCSFPEHSVGDTMGDVDATQQKVSFGYKGQNCDGTIRFVIPVRCKVSTFCSNKTDMPIAGRRILRSWTPFCATEGMTYKHCRLARRKMNCSTHKGYEVHKCDSLLKHEIYLNNIYKPGFCLLRNILVFHHKDRQVNDV